MMFITFENKYCYAINVIRIFYLGNDNIKYVILTLITYTYYILFNLKEIRKNKTC